MTDLEARRALRDTADCLFADILTPGLWHDVQAGHFPAAAWAALTEAGLPASLLPEASGGFGMDPADALSLLDAAGFHALPLPLAEAMLAGALVAGAGLELPGLSVACASHTVRLARQAGILHATGEAWDVPWARAADTVVLVATLDGQPHAVAVTVAACTLEPHANIAGEPRDTLRIDGPVQATPVSLSPEAFRATLAGTRAMLIAGALARITDMTVTYANDRKQFGKPIGRFQAVQQNLALLAGHAAAATAAADMAAESMDPPRPLTLAAAKTRAGEAAGAGAAIAHQVHGAIGFTEEYALHRYTKRLWAWRDECGTEAEWAALLGRHLAAAGPARLWETVTAL